MRLSRALLAAVLALPVADTLPAQARLRAAPSGRATSEVTLAYPADSAPPGFTPVSIRLEWGQPHLRGRVLFTDSLVPYDTPWRTGANNPSTLSTGVDLVLGGKPLAKGTYAIWTLPTREGWTLILQKGDTPDALRAAAQYAQSNDVLRVPLRVQALPAPLESLTMWVIPSRAAGAPSGELRLAWGTTQLSTEWSVR